MFIFCQPQHRAQIELVLEFAQTALTPKGYRPSHGNLQDWLGVFIQCAGNRVLQLSALNGQIIVQPLTVDTRTGEVHLRHHVSPNGYYRGKKVVKTKED